MAGENVVVRKTADASALAIGSRFKGFGPESEKSSGRADVKETKALSRLKQAWRDFRYESPTLYVLESYPGAISAIRGLDYSAEDVEALSIALSEFQEEHHFGEKAGIFLSALINQGREDAYVVNTVHLMPVHCLGYRNRKDITVHGDAGFEAGHGMESGTMMIGGDVGQAVGCAMKGGDIIVEGDAAGYACFRMEGGTITIHGSSCSLTTGTSMRGGEIHILGEFEYKGPKKTEGGKIIHRGKVVWGQR